jgi:transposase
LFFLYDSAPAQRSDLVKVFSAKKKVTTLEPPPYSPHLAPVDFYLFLRLKSALKGRRFCDATDIIKNATEELKRLPGMFPTLSQWLAEVYSCTRRLF